MPDVTPRDASASADDDPEDTARRMRVIADELADAGLMAEVHDTHNVSRPGFVGGYDALASGMIIVCSLRLSHEFSYSAGGIFPQAE
jgi:hypothetical protein